MQVAIQLPMFNERAVCQAVIDCCCEMDWPAERFHVQVLDDSTDKVTRELVDEKVAEWTERGINIKCLRRTNRQGYKAGAMKEVSKYRDIGILCMPLKGLMTRC